MEVLGGSRVPLHRIVEYLKQEATRNLFAIYDLLKEPSNSSVFLAIDGDRIRGYLLFYRGLSYPTAIVRGSSPATDRLLEKVRGERMVLFIERDALVMVRDRLDVTAVIQEDLMVVGKEEARLPSANLAERLGAKDAESILDLYSGIPHTAENRERYGRWAERHVVYGVHSGGSLVSVAGTWAETDYGWIVGGVYTSPSHRKMGYASMATSAVTSRALKGAQWSTLFVVSSNKSAIRVYEKLGYRKVAERLWVDLGTGMRPLTTES